MRLPTPQERGRVPHAGYKVLVVALFILTMVIVSLFDSMAPI